MLILAYLCWYTCINTVCMFIAKTLPSGPKSWPELRHTSALTHHVGLCFIALASHPSMCVASDVSACCWLQCLGEFQTFVHLTTSWPTDSNPLQNIKHHTISLLGSVSHKQIKGTTLFLFQLIWKCHIISKRTSVYSHLISFHFWLDNMDREEL